MLHLFATLNKSDRGLKPGVFRNIETVLIHLWPFNLSELVPSEDDLCAEDQQNYCTGPKGEG